MVYLFADSSALVNDIVLFIIIGGDAETVSVAAGPAADVSLTARPRGGLTGTNRQQPKLTSFVSVTCNYINPLKGRAVKRYTICHPGLT